MKTKQLLLIVLILLGFAKTNYSQTLPSYVPASGLVGWWPFNGNAIDESINTNDGVVNGATLTTDRFGNVNKAYGFDGLNDLINFPSIATNIIQNNLTISLWLNNTDNLDHQTVFLRQGANFTKTWILKMDNSNEIRVYNENSSYTFYTNPTTLFGTWYNLVVQISQNNIKIYINSVLIHTSSITLPLSWTNDLIYLGNSNGTGNQPYPYYGKLDDIGIWNRALTQQEITNLYNGANVGINEFSNTNLYSVYPNPASNKLTINANEQIIGLPYSIVDNTGKVLISDKLISVNTIVNIENLAAGIYMLQIGNDIKQSFKVIKE